MAPAVCRTRSPSDWCPTSHPFLFGWEGSPSKIDDRKKMGTLILTSLLEDLEEIVNQTWIKHELSFCLPG